ncbi:MAG: cation:proton antiporter [Pyrinomonadaceae bacterium]
MSEPTSVNTRDYLTYLAMLLVFGAGIWLILSFGSRQHPRPAVSPSSIEHVSTTGSPTPASTPDSSAQTESSTPAGVVRSYVERVFRQNLRSSLSVLLLQLVVIIVCARFFGSLFPRVGQPRVMGEIIAGIVLGPSLLGLISPRAMNFLFPTNSLEPLRLLSQIGVALFMFVVGMELDVAHLRKKAHTAIMVSHASIIVPFLLGTALSLLVYGSLAPSQISFTAFSLFLGIAMSITAFPVLARILEDRKLSQTPLGAIALTCAAVDDVSAWCALALVIAIAQSTGVAASLLTVALTAVFVCVMVLVIKPILARLLSARANTAQQHSALVAGVLAFVLVCALVTEAIGIHALFGAFLAGVIMPSTTGIRELLQTKLGSFSTAALLPLFFAFTGLRLQIGLMNDWQSWAMCGLIIVVAITGKLGASMLMARWTGLSWRDAFALGALMNTRGLVELVVLNIGYDLGILSARAFAMLVLMALVTTFMTGPLLSLARAKAD